MLLKQKLCESPVLRYPDYSKEFLLTTDASNKGLGAILSQEGHPCCYISRILNEAEQNYSTFEKELLAIVWTVKRLRQYLLGKKIQNSNRSPRINMVAQCQISTKTILNGKRMKKSPGKSKNQIRVAFFTREINRKKDKISSHDGSCMLFHFSLRTAGELFYQLPSAYLILCSVLYRNFQ